MLKIIKRLYTVEVWQLITSSIQSYLCKYFILKRRLIFNSSFNKNYNFNSKYLFEYFLERQSEDSLEVRFVINDRKKRKDLIEKYGPYFIETQSFKGKWYVLRSKVWITSTLETPVFSIFRHKERKVYHLGHGVPLKKIGLAEEKISKLKYLNRKLRTRIFTHVLCYSDELEDAMQKVFQNEDIKYVKLGQPRNDSLSDRKESLENFYQEEGKESRLILYAPTWRPYDKTILFPFIDLDIDKLNEFLIKENLIIFLRSHPYYEVDIKKEIIGLDRVKVLSSETVPEIMDYLNQFDLLITDYSSIYLDYLPLNKPIIFLPYDYKRYSKEVGFSLDYDKFSPGFKVVTFVDFMSSLKKSLNSEEDYECNRIKINRFINGKKQDNCKENYDFVIKQLL